MMAVEVRSPVALSWVERVYKKKPMTMAASERLRNFEAAEILSSGWEIYFLSLSFTQSVEKLKDC
jgi:hypothetical protein